MTGTTRIGILNAQTKASGDQPGNNYTAATFSQRVFQRSRIQGMFINRQSTIDGEFDKKRLRTKPELEIQLFK